MQVKDTMSVNVKTCKKDTPIKEIATIMCFNKISGLPVVDDENNLLGILSMGDVHKAVFQENLLSNKT